MECISKTNTELAADVVVIGGGTAGVFAAISAARTGAKTILIEKNSVLGHIICAGRCIASDTAANSAIRVEAVCMATGQAAGCAAALSAKSGIELKNDSYNEICDSLMAIRAIVPKENDFLSIN